ncbi:MAG TPA: ASPIC/UnbV domain-containing protein, partial [Isosphaeraceae bacterium]|nr:ASPIC/UnbV domain-containing protein [Isosphaeraceae bacterium]
VGGAGPFFDADHVARGAAFGDLDDDGDLDVVVTMMDGRPALLDNEAPDPGSWVRLDLVGRRSNRGAIGAVVEVVADGRTITRQVKGGGSYLSSNDPRLLVGLGRAARIDRVVVRWPSGARSAMKDLAPRRTYRVREPLAAAPSGRIE